MCVPCANKVRSLVIHTLSRNQSRFFYITLQYTPPCHSKCKTQRYPISVTVIALLLYKHASLLKKKEFDTRWKNNLVCDYCTPCTYAQHKWICALLLDHSLSFSLIMSLMLEKNIIWELSSMISHLSTEISCCGWNVVGVRNCVNCAKKLKHFSFVLLAQTTIFLYVD